MLTLQEKKENLEELDLCDHCLGRQFAQLGHGLENYERAQIVKQNEPLKEEHFDLAESSEIEANSGGECSYCQGLFNKLDYYAEMVLDTFERHELETYLIGIRVPENVKASEEKLWGEQGTIWTETIKTELSRLIGKKISEKDDSITVDFERPDIMAVIDMREGKERVELQVNSVLVYGQYNKYSRELPQTEWYCRHCKGDGCDECDWTGKNYPTSVEEIIQKPFMRESKALEAKFHGGGREDVDAKCLGKREFILELIEPIKREFNLQELKKEVNESQEDVEIFNVKYAEKNKVEEIKEKHADKTYRAEVKLGEEIQENNLENLQEVVGTIKQETPTRVKKRRADMTREREVYSINAEKNSEKIITIEVKAEAGTYIKELISGDEERTNPSIAGKLNTSAKCTKLDVIHIDK